MMSCVLQKKSKNNRQRLSHDELDELPTNLSDIDVDIEFPSTSNVSIDSLPSQECSVSNELQAFHLEDAIADDVSEYANKSTDAKLNSRTDDDDDGGDDDSNEVPLLLADAIDNPTAASAPPPQDLCEEPIVEAPSAPSESCPVVPAHLSPQHSVRYPDLQSMQRELHELPKVKQQTAANREKTVSVSATTSMMPFTRQQTRQIYENAELECAAQYESEFVRTELNVDHRIHPLYELLSKYWRCRQTLRINRVDVAAVQRQIDDLVPQLWKREMKTIKYRATCADEVVVHRSEQYEYVFTCI